MQSAILCEHIVHDFHGPVVGKVATILLERGPLNYSQLTRILRVPNPSLSHAHLRGALVVLIQHNMLSHSLGPLQDLFEISQDEVVARAWFGDFIAMAEDVGGSPAKVAVQAALAQGKIRVDTLVQDARALLMEEKPDQEDLAERIYPTLVWLIQQRFLTPLTDKHFLTTTDRYFGLQKAELSKLQAPSAKLKREAEARASEEFWEAVSHERDTVYARLMAGVEEAVEEDRFNADGGARPGKRRRRDEEQHEERGPNRLSIQTGLDGEVYLRVNYDRFLFRMRNRLLEGAARNRFGRAGNHVMRALLSLIEDRIEHNPSTLRLTHDLSENISTHQIIDRMSHLDPNGSSGVQSVMRSTFVSSCSVSASHSASGSWSASAQATPYLVAELCERMAYSDDMSHLTSALSGDHDNPHRGGGGKRKTWLIKVDSNSSYGSAKGNEAWQIDWFACHYALREALVHGIVGQRHGRETVRVMRILETHGRLEEKHVQKISLTSVKEARRHIDVLLQAGLVESQELPRTADRLPSRSFYLWFIDWAKATRTMRSQILQQLSNIRVRRRDEVKRCDTLVTKSQRTDVQMDKSLMKQEEWDEIGALDQRIDYLGVAEIRTMSDYLVLSLPLQLVEAKAIVPEPNQ